MKAALCTGYGPAHVVQVGIVDKPIPRKNEVLIQIIASAVNSGDVRVRALQANLFLRTIMRLVFGFRKPRQPILGTVYAGIIKEKGADVRHFNVGDAVYGLSGFRFGGHAEFIAVKENSVISRKPENASFEEAAAILFGAQTAIYFLQKSGITKRTGYRALIYGASGAVGTAAVQIANYYHAEVTAVCSKKNKDLVLGIGADKVYCHDEIDFTQVPGQYDLILDAAGKLSKKKCLHLLSSEGVFLTVGGKDYAKEKKEQLDLLREIFEKGHYRAAIDRIYSLEDIAVAHDYVENGRKSGNVVLQITSATDH